jgi:DNA-binding response OmpR family regulator
MEQNVQKVLEATMVIGHLGIAGKKIDTAIYFGRFCVRPYARQMFENGQPVEIGSRAFDLLVMLLHSRGILVTKDEIMHGLWPSTVVEDCNLRQQMSFLRKALGDYGDVIKTVQGRGYIFAADADTDPPALRALLGPRRPGCSRPSPPTVVIIDDDRDVRESLKDLLDAAGLRVELFESIQEFENSARELPPECLILDIMLPGRNGLDFHAELANARVEFPVIFISGHADIPMSVRAMKAGAVEFLTKPIRHLDLLDAIYSAIGPKTWRSSRVAQSNPCSDDRNWAPVQ